MSQSALATGGIILQTWLAQQHANHYSNHSVQHALKETHAMRTFGGEPGEDDVLIGKMQEMFDSMDWVTV